MIRHATDTIVWIWLDADEADMLHVDTDDGGQAIAGMLHNGRISYVVSGVPFDHGAYHKKIPAALTGRRIVPERLHLEGVYSIARSDPTPQILGRARSGRADSRTPVGGK